ncbi:PREDICTED: fibrous sheath-interacting protein 2-like [Condylura cristata]|uniref:fibrous sheath-interacting protein 2-like n=1 Tax=Condylura cristata TaxID=143302 RepID=UPI0006432112|nr:PREDICTED: fibrous sheath-interacting protein 2-like [Condylura cristata]
MKCLLSSFSADENRSQDPSAKVTEDSLYYSGMHSDSSIKFVTLYQRESCLDSLDAAADSEKPSTSKQGLNMLKKFPSAPSKVFLRSNASIPKPPSPSSSEDKG